MSEDTGNVCAVASDDDRTRVLRIYDSSTNCEYPIHRGFALEPHRFYVQQDAARAYEAAVRAERGSVRVVLLSNGDVVVEELSIDGKVAELAATE